MFDQSKRAPAAYPIRRIAVLGAFANPNVGDDAILDATLERIWAAFANNAIVTILTKDTSYTAPFVSRFGFRPECTTALHELSTSCGFDVNRMRQLADDILDSWEDVRKPDTIAGKLHTVFDNLDVLHIAGGGYVNSMWPDMMLEVWLAAKLADRCGARVLVTGADWGPVDDAHLSYVQDIADIACTLDFRDGTGQALLAEKEVYFLDKMTRTVDDATGYVSDRLADHNTRYGCVCIQPMFREGDGQAYAGMCENAVIPFIRRQLDSGGVDAVKVLSFSPGDFDALRTCPNFSGIEDDVELVELTGRPPRDALDVVSGACWNVGTRFHQAVMSLANDVPAYSIYCGDYYYNKLKSVHDQWQQRNTVSDYRATSFEDLCAFAEPDSLDACRGDIRKSRADVQRGIARKTELIACTYAEDGKEAETLAARMLREPSSPHPLVSVVVPAYNMCHLIGECLESIVTQSLHDIEVVVIDDGSTDRTQEVLSEWSWKDRRIRVVRQDNAGASAARERGLAEARGEYVFFCDPDDWLAGPDALEQLYCAAVSTGFPVAGGSFVERREGELSDTTVFGGNLARYTFAKNEVVDYHDFQFDFGWVRFLYSREFLLADKEGFPRLSYYEDPVWFVRTMDRAGKFAAIPEPVYRYRVAQTSKPLDARKATDLLRGILANLAFAKEKGYEQLFETTLTRLTKDYCHEILYWEVEGGNAQERTELRALLADISELAYADGRNVEAEMGLNAYRNMDGRRIHELSRADEQKMRELADAAASRACALEEQRHLHERDIASRDEAISQLNGRIAELEAKVSELYSSNTWKVGDAMLFVPKRAKEAMRRANYDKEN